MSGAAIDFPANPTLGQNFLYGSDIWQWNGKQWAAALSTGSGLSYLPTTGGVMTGPITLSGNVSGALQAPPLQQVQSIAAAYLPLSGSAAMTGTLTMGGYSITGLALTPINPSDAVSKSYVDGATTGTFLPLSGGTVTGPTTFSSNVVVGSTAMQISGIGGWSSFNIGRQLFLTTPVNYSNPALGINDASGNYPIAIINSGLANGIQFMAMPALGNTTAQPVSLGKLTQSGLTITGGSITGSASAGLTVIGNLSANVLAAGSTVSRSLAARWADEVNVLDYGADNTGATDCSVAFNNALATGKNVYAPAGTYRLNFPITVGTTTVAQRLRGDGLQTVFTIDQAFSPTATNGVITLQGREYWAPTISDIRMVFAQPSGASSRSTFKTLANGGTSGTGGTGVMYPPAIYFGLANRFRLARIQIENAWDGIVQGVSPNNSGGWWMQDIEISCYDCGLNVGTNLDISHIKGWHHWVFGMTSANFNVAFDGNTWAMRFGTGGMSQSPIMQDVFCHGASVFIDNNGTDLTFQGLYMDGGATVYVNNCQQVALNDFCITMASTEPESGNPSLYLASTNTGGWVKVTGLFGWNSTQPFIKVDGGNLTVQGGYIISTNLATPTAIQTTGVMKLDGMVFGYPTGTVTAIPVHCSGGGLNFTNNLCRSQSPSNQIFVQIDHDSTGHVVTGNAFGQWAFVAPGPLGNYGINGVMNTTIAPTGSATTHSFGDLPSLGGTYNNGTHGVGLASVDSAGHVHIGGNSQGVIFDPQLFINGAVYVDNTLSIIVNPLNGSSHTLLDYKLTNLLQLTANITSLTVVMPPNPNQNQMCRIAVNQYGITNFTLSPNTGQTISGVPITLPANSGMLFIYAGNNWFRLQ